MKRFNTTVAIILTATSALADTAVRIASETDTSHEKNVAREHLGAGMLGSSGEVVATGGSQDVNGAPRAMLLSDPSVGLPLPAGRNFHVVDFGRIQMVDRISFINRGGAGKVVIRAALTSGDLEATEFTGQSYTVFGEDDVVISVNLGGVDVRYLRIETEITTAGRMYDFGAFGPKLASSYALTYASGGGEGDEGVHLTGINLATPIAGSDVVYVSSGLVSAVSSLVDEDASTQHAFSRSDKNAVTIIDTGRNMSIARASSVVMARAAGTFDVFVLNELPESVDWADHTKVDTSFLDSLTPVGTAEYTEGVSPVAVNCEATGRYIVLRWHSSKGGLAVADVAAFSPDMTLAQYSVGEPDPDKGGIAGQDFDKNPAGEMADTAEDNGSFPVTGYSGVLGGRNPNGLSPNFVPVCLAVSWGGRDNVPEYVIEALNRYLDATDDYDGCRPAILNHLTEIVRYGSPLRELAE